MEVSPLEGTDVSAEHGVPAGPGAGPAAPSDPLRDRLAVREVVVGAVVIVVVVLAGVYLSGHDGGVVDRWLFRLVPSGHSWFTAVTRLRYPAVTLVGAAAAAAVAFRRDRPRAVACLIGPPLALLTGELAIKPVVGRTLGGAYSYPSGSAVGAAALAVAAVLAVPPTWRRAAAVVAVVFALWMAAAVVALRWHYPTDALAGLAYGAAVVVVADGAARLVAVRSHRWWVRHRRRRRS